MPHRFVVFTDRKRDMPSHLVEQQGLVDTYLIGKGCFCRLRMFDPEWQREHKMDERIVALDLDDVIVGPLDDVFHTSEKFMILQGVNALNPNPYNCSVVLLRAGTHPEVWRDFSLEKAARIKFHEFPDDQGWIWHKLPNARGWKGGETSGIYAFQKPGWVGPGNQLPRNARIVAFFGWRKPSLFKDVPWVQKHWRTGL